MALVGLDVHRSRTVAAVLDPVTGELRLERLRGEPERVVPTFLEELDRPVAAVYEAGPTGFVLARVAERRGLDRTWPAEYPAGDQPMECSDLPVTLELSRLVLGRL